MGAPRSPQQPPRRKMTPEEAKQFTDKIEQDMGAAFGFVTRLTKAAVKVAVQPRIETAKKIVRAFLEDD
jgi:hypothetical protein